MEQEKIICDFNREHLTARIPTSLKEAVIIRAEKEGETVSSVVRKILTVEFGQKRRSKI